MANIIDQVLSAAMTSLHNMEDKITEFAKSIKDKENVSSTEFLELQSMASQYQMAVSTTSATLKNFADTMQGVIQKIG